MPASRPSATATRQIIADLARVPPIQSLGPIAARFIYSLRLIALHERFERDPVPELATRLGSFETAAKALALSQAIAATWPENINVSRFCCCALTHDEVTIGALIDAVAAHDRQGFERAIEGLVRPARVEILWDAMFDLVVADMRSS